MKKLSMILCILAAMLMAFSACAETATRAADVTVNVDVDQILSLTGTEADEQTLASLAVLEDVLSRLQAFCLYGENRVEEFTMLDDTIIDYSYADMSNGIELYSSEIPNFVFRVTPEDLEQLTGMLGMIGNLVQEIDTTAYTDLLMEFVSSVEVVNDTVTETVDGITFTDLSLVVVTGEQVTDLVRKLAAKIEEDLQQAGMNISLTSQLPETGITGTAKIGLFTNEEGYSYFLASDFEGEKLLSALMSPDGKIAFDGFGLNGLIEMEETGFQLTLYMGEETITISVNAGENGAVVMVTTGDNEQQIVFEVVANNMENASEVTADLNVNGMQILRAVVLNAANPEVSTYGGNVQVYLLGSSEALFGVDFASYPYEEEMMGFAAPAEATVIGLNDLTDPEKLQEILNAVIEDMMSNGLPAELNKLMEAAPELAPLFATAE